MTKMDIFFPIEFNTQDGIGGPVPADAGTIYVCRDEFNPDDWPDDKCDALVAKATLTELVESCLEGWRGRDGFSCEESYSRSDALAAALRAAADLLDSRKKP